MKKFPTRPPAFFRHLFRWYCNPNIHHYIEGDLMEVYFERLRSSGKRKADIRFIIDIIFLFRPGIIRPIRGYRNPNYRGMYKNHFKTGWRNLIRNKGYAFLNIGGLALAMTCSSIIFLYVDNEFSFDRFHRHPEDIYRVVKDFVNEDGTKVPDATTPPALARALRDELPEVEASTRFLSGNRLYLLQYGEKRFYETKVLRVDESFFDVFDFAFLQGDKKTALKEIHSIIFTETLAKKYFGGEDPIGKVIQMNLNNGTDFVVSGVIKDVPQNSHFTFDFIIPFESRRNPDADWQWNGFYTYARLRPASSPVLFESHVKDIVKKNKPNTTDEYYTQHLTDIHLKSRLKWELQVNGDLFNVKIMIAIGLFIILIAAINYINLVTAQSTKRAKEIGIRKVTGANRYLLTRQFLVESVLTASVALVLSIVLTASLLPLTSSVLGYDLSPVFFHGPFIMLILPASALVIGLLAGLYPALYVSGFDPIKILRGGFLNTNRTITMRQGLVVFQFVISTSLVIGSFIIIRQLDFMKQKDLGFDKDNVLLLPNVRGGIGGSVSDPAAMLEELKKIPGITHIARADGVLGSSNSTNGVGTKDNKTHIALNFVRADYEFLPTLGIRMKDGRNFSEEFVTDSEAIILNESAVAQLGLKQPLVGQQLTWDDEEGRTHAVNVIGIVEDFHFASLKESIKPFGFILEVGNGSTFFVKLQDQNLKRSMAKVEKVWRAFNPEKPFQFSFMDEQFDKLYIAESRFQTLFSGFTILALFITCLGIFGLVTYLAESKTKEIGIRKVLGASISGIVYILSKDFLVLIIIALFIASPLAYVCMRSWLQGFAYRNGIGWDIFAITAIVSVLITLITVSYQAIKAAMANPVRSLRSE